MITGVKVHIPPSFSHSSLRLLEESTQRQDFHIGTAKLRHLSNTHKKYLTNRNIQTKLCAYCHCSYICQEEEKVIIFQLHVKQK